MPIASRESRGDTLPYVRGSIIVKFKDDVTRGGITAGDRAGRGDARRSVVVGGLRHRRYPGNADPEAAAAAMRARPDVEYAQPRYRNYAMARPNDTLYANQWNFPAIDMERAWDIQPGASRTSSSRCSTAAWRSESGTFATTRASRSG